MVKKSRTAASRRARPAKDDAQFRIAIEASPSGMIMVDALGVIVMVNREAERIFGYAKDELVGRRLDVLIPERLRERHQVLHDAYAVSHQARAMGAGRDLRGVRKSGEEIPIEIGLNHVEMPEGRFVLASVVDITERKRAEEILKDREERLRQLTDNMNDVFYLNSADFSTLLYVSPGYATLWGRSCESLYQAPQSFVEGVHPDDRAALFASIERLRAGERIEVEFRVVRPDGSVRRVVSRAAPVPTTAGSIDRIAGMATDVTDLRRAEEQMKQAQKMEAVGRLAGGVAHDFNNLLTVILGEADMAQLEATEPRVKESLAEITKASERAAVLTRQLLMFSRHQVVEPTTFNLNDAVADMDKMLRRLIGEDIRVETILAPDAGVIRADRGQIEQVLANLVVNARDAMPNGGRLVIETTAFENAEARPETTGMLPMGRYALFTITDSGTGMDAETRSHIFEPFFTTKEAGKGTGLGLSTVYGIVQHCGGQIGVYSEPGFGTTFRVYLPVIEGDPSRSRLSRPSAGILEGTETVLLVEDETAVRRLARLSLERRGYLVLEAGDPAEALATAGAFEGEIHILVTDVVMPGMGGQDLVARIRPLRPHMKILFTSGYTERSVGLPGAAGKPPAFIQKPFTPEELLRKVRRVLDD